MNKTVNMKFKTSIDDNVSSFIHSFKNPNANYFLKEGSMQ